MDHTTFAEPPDQPPPTRPATRCRTCPSGQTVVDPSGVYRWVPVNNNRGAAGWVELDRKD